jgi:hypothetical protein
MKFTNSFPVILSLFETDVFQTEILNGSVGNNLQSKDGQCRESHGLRIDILTIKKRSSPYAHSILVQRPLNA